MTGLATLARRMNLRHFARRRLRTALTLTGVAAGVALVFSISVINATLLQSFRSSVRDLAGRAELEVAAAGQVGLPHGVVQRVERVRGVEQAVPVLRTTTRVVGPKGAARVLVLGVTEGFGTLFPQDPGPLAQLEFKGGLGGLALARTVANEIGAGLDETVRMEVPSGQARVEVSGIFGGGAVAFVNGGNAGVMTLPGAQRTFERPGRIDSVYVVADLATPLGDVERRLEDALGGAAVIGPPGERAQGLERVYTGLATLLSLAGTVALFVALFVVYNTMSMSLAERRREISMAMALGATRREIFAAFLGEAAVFGAIAATLGVIGGLGLARLLVERAAEGYRVLPIAAAGPLVVPPSSVVTALAGGFVVSLVGAFVPARRVLSVAPVEALRPEAAYEWEPTRAFGFNTGTVGIVGTLCLGVAAALFVGSIVFPEATWIPTLGIVAGLSGVTLLLPRFVPPAVELLRTGFARAFGTVGRLAGDSLAKNPGRTTFTVAALVLTLTVAIGVGSALGSYQAQVQRFADAVIGAPIYVTARSYTGLVSDQPLPGSLRERIERVRGVRYVYPLRFSLINVGAEQAVLYAVPVEEAIREGATTQLDERTLAADPDVFIAGLEGGAVAISRLTSERHELEAGEEIELRTPSGKRSFEIAAIFEDLVGFDSLYIDYETYTSIWREHKADEFGVLLDDGASVSEVTRRLDRLVDRTGVPARVFTKDDLIGRLLDTVEGTFSLGRGIQLAALIVALLTIANTMFTAVFERRWEMGLERAVGMSSSQLAREVLLEASGIGLIGGIGGAALGIVAGFLMTQSLEAQFSWQVPFEIPFVQVVVAITGGVVLAAVAGWLPSRLAVRSPIVEALRYE
jgi:putative ABC transport system permease protein